MLWNLSLSIEGEGDEKRIFQGEKSYRELINGNVPGINGKIRINYEVFLEHICHLSHA
jgi:hypothetical protein